MGMFTRLLLGSILFVSYSAFSKEFIVHVGSECHLRVVVEEPVDSPPKADVLFLIGFADRADNHGPLFRQLADRGFRVLSYDYPSHGETRCGNLNDHSYASLQRLTRAVVSAPLLASDRPLHIVGWSAGGLLAYRILQNQVIADRKIVNAVLMAPALAVRFLPGIYHDQFIEPDGSGSEFYLYPMFGANLLATARQARMDAPPKTPIQMILAGDSKDYYVNTPKIKQWWGQLNVESFGTIQCPNGYHELDNDQPPVGGMVRDFVADVLSERAGGEYPKDVCYRLRPKASLK